MNSKIDQQLKLINQYAEEQENSIDTISKMNDLADKQKEKIKLLENEMKFLKNKPYKDQQIQWKILEGIFSKWLIKVLN